MCMSFVQRLLERFGLADTSDDASDPYRCIRCGATFERQHHDCPECGVPYVVSEDADD